MTSRHKRGADAWRRGRAAERLAAWMLRAKGFWIVAERFACPQGEVDLIVRRGRLLVFVEVKARHDSAAAAEAITWRQRQRIARAAEIFLQQRPEFTGFDLRFDAVVMGIRDRPRHMADAWRPEV